MTLPRFPSARDRAWLAVSFAFGLAVSWHRWSSPIIDTGREMNQPLRLKNGETLYSDVRHIYGPLSPSLHAALFRAFGPSLAVLYADGIVSSAIVLALVYWLARRVLPEDAAGAAALSVTWLCVFKPSGNYILPYSFNALHGTVLGLIALAISVAALERRRTSLFFLAGIVAGIDLLAKTEMGLAALAAGTTAAMLAAYPDARRGIKRAVVFVAPAVCVTAAVYGLIASRVGWSTLVSDNWLLAYNLPRELVYYNRQISGFDHPLLSVGRMLLAAIKLGIVAAIVASVSILIGNRTANRERNGANETGQRRIVARAWYGLAGAVALMIGLSVTTGLDWDKGPYLAMPILLAGLLVMFTRRLRADPSRSTGTRTAILIVYAVYALASLARMILHVRSGGAYGSYLLPMSVVLFTYAWIESFPDRFRRTRYAARAVALTMILTVAVGTAGVLAFRYRKTGTALITTARGTMRAAPDVAQAWNEALSYIEAHTQPGDAVAVMPEGTSLDFLSGRRNPLREEIVTPGYLDAAGEARAIRQLQVADARLILITNRLTEEFGPAVFGRDYCVRLMEWIETRYAVCAVFGPVKDRAQQIGGKPFFIRAYCANAH